MIRHIYLFKFKEKDKIEEAANMILTLKDHIPYMQDIEVGIDFKGAENSYELCELCTFKTKEDFLRFGSDPYHAKVREYMDAVRESGVKIDYEIDD